uniref:UDP-galactose transporter n=1 Tax=Piliocolobus tephrosceles TaxID=591936 RepID=A0A8C9J5B5_9PRIM
MEKQCCSHLIIYPLSTMYTFLLGAIFIALSSSHILLVKYAANEENKYDYLPTTVNVCSELVKLVFCVLVSFCVIKKDNCITKEWTFPEAKWNTTVKVFSHVHLSMGHVLIIVQCFISSMANICNEKILKEGNQLTESIFIQNSKLCFFGILFNGLTLGLQRSNRDQIKNLALIFVTAFQGLSMVFILKFLDIPCLKGPGYHCHYHNSVCPGL